MLLHFYAVKEDHNHKSVFLWKRFIIMLPYTNRITAVYEFLILHVGIILILGPYHF
jgi:hypothetical protein